MELREFFGVFIVYKKLFWSIVCGITLIGCIYYFVQPQMYQTSLILNITRSGVQNVDVYTYDDFYRLQADERFADTIVRWIESPYVGVTVLGQEHDDIFSAKRLSSQVVDVTYNTNTIKEGREIAVKLIDTLNVEAQKLNYTQQQANWFVILGSNPIVQDHTYTLFFLFLLGSAIGFFCAFWAVLVMHYIGKEETHK